MNNNIINNNIPWMEKYRPKNINHIILDEYNKRIIENIIDKNIFPNLLLHGPPGTGKTTTIINLVNIYQKNNNQKNSELTIHLNASDDRGIDIIRNQIYQFVNSKSLFNEGLKIIILDEVDYMTKSAQQALKYLLNEINDDNVRFCLICNYISKIDKSLQSEFIHLKFNLLPAITVVNFLKNINNIENLNYSDDDLLSIQRNYDSDIRSMINYMQSNKDFKNINKIIKNEIWDNLTNEIKKKNIDYIDYIIDEYNIQLKNMITDYLKYIIINKQEFVNSEFLDISEFIVHLEDYREIYLKKFFIEAMFHLYKNFN